MRATGVAVAALLVLAGCAAPVADAPGAPGATTTSTTSTTSTTTTTTTAATTAPEPPAIAIRNGTLPTDPNATFRRVRSVLATDAVAPEYVAVVGSPEDLVPGGGGQRVPRFWRLLGVAPERALTDDERERLENGVTTFAGIRLYPGEGDPATVEWLLAHEFVHYVQLRRGHDAALREALGRSTDARTFVTRAVLEGVAVYATDAYVREYLPGAEPSRLLYERLHRQIPPGSPARYTNLAYLAGRRYVADRFASPAAADAVYADPPTTSEQLLHRTDEPPTPLRVRATAEGWRAVGSDRLGEAFLRVALENGLDPERAARAAAGWGNDSLRVFRPVGGGDPGYVWVLRFDDGAEAADAAAALRGSLSARGNRSAEGWRVAGVRAALARPDDRTLALAVGPGRFVNATAVDSDGGGVRVAVG